MAEIKHSRRGGLRVGAGRPKKESKQAPTPDKCVATAILGKIGIQERIESLLKMTDPTNHQMQVKFASSPTLYMRAIEQHWEILDKLMDRSLGRPKQAVEMSGANGGRIESAIEVTFVTSNAGQS